MQQTLEAEAVHFYEAPFSSKQTQQYEAILDHILF